MRATTFSLDNLERQVLRNGDFFQLHIEVSGGKVEWWKDGELVPNMEPGRMVNVNQACRTQLLKPGTYKSFNFKEDNYFRFPKRFRFLFKVSKITIES